MQSNSTGRYSEWLKPAAPLNELINRIKNNPFSNADKESAAEKVKLYRNESITKPTVYIGMGTCGIGSGAAKSMEAVKSFMKENKIDADIISVGCLGLCSIEPIVDLQLPGKARLSFHSVTADKVESIFANVFKGSVDKEHFLGQYRSDDLEKWENLKFVDEHPFLENQVRWVLSNSGVINPTDLNSYISRGGYSSLAKILAHESPESVVDIMEKSMLRGRGGGGFSTGKKWRIARTSPETERYMVCNADEGDPGAFMDRAVIESDTYRLLEGLTIAAYAIGAQTAYVYIRAEYPLAIERLIEAIGKAKEAGLLGKNILGSGYNLDVKIKKGAGAFVCGEETALIHSIEGKRGMPRPRPPYPAAEGLFNKPTIINNVETLANVPVVFELGWEKYASLGVETSKGTKVFALSGMVNRTGLVEVPMGDTIKDIVYDIGGGIIGNKKCKAVQMGGPSGGCIPASHLDVPIDYESLKRLGAIMGSGGMVVMDEGTCMVDLAKYFMEFIQSESCGKCIPCREGTRKILETLKAITRGTHSEKDTDALNRFKLIMDLEDLAVKVKEISLCGLGQTAPNPVLSTLRWFRDEYEAHIFDRHCPAGVCVELSTIPCQTGCPVGTEVWKYVAHTARGEYEEAYKVIRNSNPFPSACARVCNHPCEDRCRCNTTGGEPIAVRTLKRFIVDRVAPSVFKYDFISADDSSPRVAVIGGGPSGLTAAHELSIKGYKVTIFEKEDVLGGMLSCVIPSYRMPRDVLNSEIKALLNDNINVKYGQTFGENVTIDKLFAEGYKSIYISTGSHRGLNLGIPGENTGGVIPSIVYLRKFNVHGANLARGKVAIIGGGNSAIDAARVSLRQYFIDSVTIYYRRDIESMPAYQEEIKAAIEEGIKIVPLTSPVEITSKDGKISKLKLIKNKLGEPDKSGRRSPVAIDGSEFEVDVDTLIVAISERPDTEKFGNFSKGKLGNLNINTDTMETSVKGVFAGGDVIASARTNTVVEAIANGRKAAEKIDRYLQGKPLYTPEIKKFPNVYLKPADFDPDEIAAIKRVHPIELDPKIRRECFREVEMPISETDARNEALRCLRCDLTFTQCKANN